VAVFGLLAMPPSAVSVTPNSGGGSPQTFVFDFSDPKGAADIVSTQIDFGASLAAGPWDYYGGSPCDYELTIGGYYRGAGWDRYWLCGPGAYHGGGPW